MKDPPTLLEQGQAQADEEADRWKQVLDIAQWHRTEL